MTDPFAKIPESDWLFETEHFFAVPDSFPVTQGHLLIISKEAHRGYRDLPDEAKQNLISAIDQGIAYLIEREDPDGFNVGMNCGEAAGQTVFHFHCHVIPRRKGDVEDPRGGIRHAVMGQGYY